MGANRVAVEMVPVRLSRAGMLLAFKFATVNHPDKVPDSYTHTHFVLLPVLILLRRLHQLLITFQSHILSFKAPQVWPL